MLQQNLMMKHVPSWCSDGEELEHERIARQEKMSDLEIVCRALMIQKRQIEEKDKLIEVLQPRADYCDEVLDSIDCMTMTQVAVSEPKVFHRHEKSRFEVFSEPTM